MLIQNTPHVFFILLLWKYAHGAFFDVSHICILASYTFWHYNFKYYYLCCFFPDLLGVFPTWQELNKLPERVQVEWYLDSSSKESFLAMLQ
jgi:hypothetical protein